MRLPTPGRICNVGLTSLPEYGILQWKGKDYDHSKKVAIYGGRWDSHGCRSPESSSPDIKPQIDAGMLGLRSHTRAHGRPGQAGWHRIDVPQPGHRGNVLSNGALSRIRRLRDVSVVVRRLAVRG